MVVFDLKRDTPPVRRNLRFFPAPSVSFLALRFLCFSSDTCFPKLFGPRTPILTDVFQVRRGFDPPSPDASSLPTRFQFQCDLRPQWVDWYGDTRSSHDEPPSLCPFPFFPPLLCLTWTIEEFRSIFPFVFFPLSDPLVGFGG